MGWKKRNEKHSTYNTYIQHMLVRNNKLMFLWSYFFIVILVITTRWHQNQTTLQCCRSKSRSRIPKITSYQSTSNVFCLNKKNKKHYISIERELWQFNRENRWHWVNGKIDITRNKPLDGPIILRSGWPAVMSSSTSTQVTIKQYLKCKRYGKWLKGKLLPHQELVCNVRWRYVTLDYIY